MYTIPEWLLELGRENPAEYVDIIGRGSLYRVSYRYPNNTGGPFIGTLSTEFPFELNDTFPWWFGVACVTKIKRGKQ